MVLVETHDGKGTATPPIGPSLSYPTSREKCGGGSSDRRRLFSSVPLILSLDFIRLQCPGTESEILLRSVGMCVGSPNTKQRQTRKRKTDPHSA
ncbi:hypothetical protein Pmani_012244 [Petrolisthes manimaculis]|uniref:Uncharacterized protein n=1 Tax=Petrolisthes manimaculis TaxID=1843537 RepID=A0AAE1UDF6_9EUCA|nr:hypothetical protein Pmani_012244 [Petrolisthes manimaculis]